MFQLKRVLMAVEVTGKRCDHFASAKVCDGKRLSFLSFRQMREKQVFPQTL